MVLLIDHRRTILQPTGGFFVGHVVPEAQVGDSIASAEDCNEITINSESRKLEANVCEEGLAQRKSK